MGCQLDCHPNTLRPLDQKSYKILNFPTLLGLFEGVGLLEAPSISKFVPYLRAGTTLAGGGRELGNEVERFRLTFGLQPASG